MNVTQCKSCKATIVYLPTPKGASMPVDYSSVQANDIGYDKTRHISHWSSCPYANQHHKKKKP